MLGQQCLQPLNMTSWGQLHSRLSTWTSSVVASVGVVVRTPCEVKQRQQLHSIEAATLAPCSTGTSSNHHLIKPVLNATVATYSKSSSGKTTLGPHQWLDNIGVTLAGQDQGLVSGTFMELTTNCTCLIIVDISLIPNHELRQTFQHFTSFFFVETKT